MAAPPLTYLEQKRMASLSAGGQVIESARQNQNRKTIQDNNRDSWRNVDTLGRKTLATLGRWVSVNFGVVTGTLEEIADTVCDNICPQFKGEDVAWGELAEEYLKENDKISNVRGHPYTTQETERQIVLGAFRVGDLYVLNTESASGVPQHQVIPSHRIGSGVTESTVQGGPWDGAKIHDGVILNEQLRPVAYRYLVSDTGWSRGQVLRSERIDDANGFPQQVRYLGPIGELLYVDISARTMHQAYLPVWEDQVRGYSILGASVFNWQDMREARAFDMINRKLAASRAIIEYNDPGEADSGTILDDPDSDRSDDDNNVTSLHNEKVDGVTVSYFRAKSGSRIEAMEDKRPTSEQQEFENTIIRSELHAIGWSYDFSYNPNNVKGAMARVVVDRINRRAKNLRNRLVIPWRRRFDLFRIAKAMKNGDLPFNDEWFKWSYSGHTPITADAKYDADVDINTSRAGMNTLQLVANKRNFDWKDLRRQREEEARDLFERARRLSDEFNISMDAALKELQRMDNGNSSADVEKQPQETNDEDEET